MIGLVFLEMTLVVTVAGDAAKGGSRARRVRMVAGECSRFVVSAGGVSWRAIMALVSFGSTWAS